MHPRSVFILFICSLLCLHLKAQDNKAISGIVTNAGSGEILAGASITLYKAGRISGLISNKDGRFIISSGEIDSARFSMVGYRSITLYPNQLTEKDFIRVKLPESPSVLEEVVVKPPLAIEIIKQAIAKIRVYQPQDNFESRGFYREIIKDRKEYFSVAEAIFTAQFFPKKTSYKLKLERGRSKEDVGYTKLFEDFHPSGGPQLAIGSSFLAARPDFLNLKKINDFSYKIDKLLKSDDRLLYCISFDQKPGVKEALDKGKVYIDADDYSIVKYEAENSPNGMAYVKNLTGTDKVFAALLHIDFQRKGWRRQVDFSRVNDQWLLSHADVELKIGYKQPKKNIDLDLTINTELLMTDLQSPLKKEISKDEEWKRKNLVMNLPSAFDSAYWGDNNVISPTEEIKKIVASIPMNTADTAASVALDNWQYINRNVFVAYRRNDSITLIPLMKSNWEDEEAGGMIYKEMDGDFIVESKIQVTKNSTVGEMPDRGFQQAGIIVRSDNDQKQNYMMLSIGTGGNPNPKIFFKRTTDNKSKTVVVKKDGMDGWLRIEKKGKKIAAFFKPAETDAWEKISEYEMEWLNGKLQVGLSIFANFAGQGPKANPDMKAGFSNLKIQ